MKAKEIKYIVIHTSAGYGNVESIKKFWKETLKWKVGGYHRIIDLEGNIHNLYPFDVSLNGVKGYNSQCLHISYIGGVSKTNVNKAEDTRTQKQKEAIIECIVEAQIWIVHNGGNINTVKILGHRDFSPDKNGNGIIESWERIKECPSFDAISEYAYLQSKRP